MNFNVRVNIDDRGNKEQPDIRPIKESGEIYMSYKPFTVFINDFSITVPDKFRSDGASVPQWAWSISGLSRDGMHRAAAHAHDYIYEKKGIGVAPIPFSRKMADMLFADLLELYGIKKWQVFVMYVSVRLFGGTVWDE